MKIVIVGVLVLFFFGCAAGKPRNLPSDRVEHNPGIFCKIMPGVYESRRFRYVKGKRGYIASKK